MRATVISLGGSLIVPDRIDISFLKSFKSLIMGRKDRFIIICGGGRTCRDYQEAAKSIAEISQEDLDWVGIASTKLNAELVRSVFGKDAYGRVIGPREQIDTSKKIIISAGFHPGWSSDMASVLLAEKFKASAVINMSNIDMVYDKDPKKNKDAKPMKRLSWQEFFKIVGDRWKPGMNAPFDPVSAKKAQELGIKVIVINGSIANLEAFLDGKPFIGTTIG